MYDCISWINRNYKKSRCSSFKKVFGFWQRILYYDIRKSGKEMGSSKRYATEKNAIVNVYELSEEWSGFRVLSFEKENEKWLDFVCACRKGQSLNKEYDIIIGNVADDDVFKTVDMYFRGLWNKEKVLNELRYYKMNNQICIVKQEALDCLLTFQKAYEVNSNGK